MKNSYLQALAFLLLASTMLLQSCIKDTCEKTYNYTYYAPVYKTKTEVKNNIKSSSPQQIVNPGKIYMLGNYIFLNEVDKGIHIIDNSNPSSPQNVSFINIPGNIDIAVKGNTLYADVYTDMVAINISNPLNATATKFIEGVFPFRYWGTGFRPDSTLVIADWVMRDTSVTESCNAGDNNIVFNDAVFFSPSAALYNNSGTKASSSPIGAGGSMARFALVSNRLYTVSTSDLSVFNIANAQNPSYVSKTNIANWAIETIFPFKNKLFIGSTNGMFIYSISNADNPQLEGQFSHVQSCDPIIADENFAYVTLSGGSRCGGNSNQMDVLDISNINNPVLVKSYPLTNPKGLSKDKNLLFVCDGTDGVKVFNAASASNITQLKQITGMETYDVIAANDVALVIAKDGLYQYSYADINNIHLLSKIAVSAK